MSYRVRAKEFILEADSIEEFRNILIMLGIAPESKPKTIGIVETIAPTPTKMEAVNASPVSLEDRLQKFYKRLLLSPNSSMVRTLKTLSENPNGLVDSKLRELLGLKGAGLGGTMGGLSKRAEPCGLSLYRDILVKEDEDGSVRYCLTDSMRKLMEAKEQPKQGLIY